ncbi:MAG TPA: Gldg family protein, partial [Sphingobacterium sp.]|nr:Gldg family protein [Sphingobacterium sp.]
MQKILRIARLELAVLFYSPIAWLLLAIFVVQCGIAYTSMLYKTETFQQLGQQLPPMTRALFAGEDGVLSKISQTLYLYIPLLTMSLMSREISSGSIKLLQSSPVTNLQVVLGKFVGIMGYGLLLCTVIILYMLFGLYSVPSLDIGFVLGGTLGLFLLLCTYAAIGLFMSSLTGYPIVAAISTLAALSVFNYIGHLGQGVDGLREVTYWLALSGKVEGIINGLLTSRELCYFIAVTAFFLVLTVARLNAGRKHRQLGARMAFYTGLVTALIMVVVISSRPGFIRYWDTTRMNDQTLSQRSQELITRIDGPIKLTTYTNLLDPDRRVSLGEPKNRIKDRRRFESYQRFLPHLEMNYINYYDSVKYGLDTAKTMEEQARHIAKVRGFNFDKVLSPAEIQRKIDLSREENTFVRMLEYKGKITPLRMFEDMRVYPGESEVMAAFKRLIDSAATIWVLGANGERSIDQMNNNGYQIVTGGILVRASLINQGFDTKSVALDTITEIPLTLTVLVIADPMEAYDEASLTKITRYINAGGNLLLAGEPGKQALVNPIAEKLGVTLQEGTVMEESAFREADDVQALFSSQADSLGLGLFENAKVALPGVAHLHIADSSVFQITPLLVSNPIATWNKTGAYDLTKEKIKFDPATEQKEQLTLLAALSREVNGREQRIVVSGDADFLNNVNIQRVGVQNAHFVITRLFRWYSNGEYPYSPNGEQAKDREITVDRSGVNRQRII